VTGLVPPLVAIVDFAADGGALPANASADAFRRIFRLPARIVRADRIEEVVATIDAAEAMARDGAWVVGMVAYEAAPALDAAFAVASAVDALPLVWFAAFDRPGEPVASGGEASRAVARLAAETDGVDELVELDPTTPLTDADYSASVERIREYIASGDVYQVNLTVPFSSAGGDPRQLYERMRRAQGGRFSAYLDLGDAQIMSASPELFFERRGVVLRSRPMKGTTPRGLHPAADVAAREALLRSEKDRAENVMIVDVVRNDVGRIARIGSVSVTSLCEPERYPSVWQLTSTVQGEVDRDVPLSRIFGAMFPPASISGAPKIRATEIIQELEVGPRGVYCGAIGVIEPGGDARFSVAIRTAWTSDGGRTVHLNSGGGVTIDSTPAGELAEVRAKLGSFTRVRPASALFETVRIERGAVLRSALHLDRLAASADYFEFPFDRERTARLLAESGAESAVEAVWRGRLVLEPDGGLRMSVEPFRGAWLDSAQPAKRAVWRPASFSAAAARPVRVAERPVDRGDLRLYHKTVDRAVYDDAMATFPAAFDVLLWNADGEATEFTRGNVVVELDGALWTPPVDCGLLGGVLRRELVELGAVAERVISMEELRSAERVWFVNALRGVVEVEVTW
jgi:para-aminobenzoate synthetase/4-amino-4-deoxychorismate lyase